MADENTTQTPDPKLEEKKTQEAVVTDLTNDKKPADTKSEAFEYAFPESVSHPESLTKLGNEHKITQDQMAAVLGYWDNAKKVDQEKYKKEVTDGFKALQGKWGEEIEGNVKLAQEAVKILDQRVGGGLAALLKRSGGANHPVLLELFHSLAKDLGLDKKPSPPPRSKQVPTDAAGDKKGRKKPLDRLYSVEEEK